MQQFNYLFKLLFTVQEGQFVRIVISVVKNLKIYTTVCLYGYKVIIPLLKIFVIYYKN